ncbi:MAG TPA: TonB-dependent receptor [Caulobacteraceae bacterium]|jgi:outer membrane receptor protein involved in Fe transport
MARRSAWLEACAAVAALAAPALARANDAAPADSAAAPEVVVTAQRLDVARATVEPSLGASTYSLSAATVNALPGGENTSLNQVILQAPGVVQDSFGQLHIRGDHADIQYRINNVILPEGPSAFGQVLSPRLADSTELITGALPAQYGLDTAGVINITTKSGLANGGEAGVYGGSHDEIEPSGSYGGSSGGDNYFVSGSYLGDNLGIESPDGSADPLHDHTDQYQGFAYLDHIIDPDSRLSLMLGTSDENFQIPDRHGLNAGDPGGLGLDVNGQTSFASETLNENQREDTQFGALSYLRATEKTTLQLSVFTRYSTLDFTPDPVGDLLFNGIAESAQKSDLATGLQAEGVYDLSDQHTLRGGVIVQADRAISDTASQVLPTDASGAQTSTSPETIVDDTAATEVEASVYAQDEWKPIDGVTVNYGLRFDQVNAYRDQNQLSPRVNVVWKPLSGTTLHIGYAHYFTPPPFELVGAESVARFAGTTAAPAVTQDTLPFAETDDYYDVGAQQRVGHVLLGLDGYWRDAKNLIDEGQFGAPIIQTPFNYAVGRIRGVELSATYAKGPFSAWTNLAISEAEGRDIVSSQFNFSPDELAYIAANFIHLDHDQTYTASGGASYTWGHLKLSTDLLYGSGLRNDLVLADGEDIPNGGHVPGYVQVNLSAAYKIDLGKAGPLTLRFDVINVAGAQYEIRDGTGVGVGAPQFGPSRGFFGGVTKSF